MHSPYHPPRGLRGLAARFSAAAGTVETQPLLDPRSKLVYSLLAGAGAVELAILLLTSFTFDNVVFLRLFTSLLTFLVAGLLARRYGLPRIATCLEMLALPAVIGALIGTGAFMATAISHPLADDMLSSVDQALGLDWVGLFRFYQRHPELVPAARSIYFSMVPQLSIIPLILVATGREGRAWVFITAYALAGIGTVVIYPLAPAAGPYVHYGISPDDLPELHLTFPWAFGKVIEAIRAGTLLEISQSGGGGLVSMPSFHAASGLLLAWAIAPVRWLRVPLVSLNAVMIFATVTIGSHYFIDVIGGVFVAAVAIVIAKAATAKHQRQ